MPQAPRSAWGRGATGLLLALLALPAAQAQPEPPVFGVELEMRGREVTPTRTTERSFADYKRVLEPVVRALGGDPAGIKRVDFSVPGPDGQPRPLIRATWTDTQGRTWRVEPEWVSGGGRQQVDFEVVTPKLSDPAELERVVRALNQSGVVREGLQSSAHIHVDGRGLIQNGNATALINLINLHETYEPLLRRLFRPMRGAGIYNPRSPGTGPEGAWANRFSRPLYQDHPGLLAELAALPPEKRTRAEVERLFNARAEAEAKLHGGTELGKQGWKYRSLNVANLLDVNPNLPPTKGSIEFRLNDLDLKNPETHRLQVELYRALIERATALAKEGKVVPAPKHPAVAAGENPAAAIAGADPAAAKAKLRAMLKDLGLDPARYETMLQRNVVAPAALSAAEFEARSRALRLDTAVRVGEGQGEAGLAAALEGLRQGRSGELILRVPGGADATEALGRARAMGARVDVALHLRAVAHAGARAAVPYRERVRVALEGGQVVFRIQPQQLKLTDLTRISRVLAASVRRPGVEGVALPASKSLAERAAEYADRAEGRRLSARTLEALRWIEAAAGKQALLPLRAWGNQPYVPGPTARDLRFRADRYLSQVVAIAEATPSSSVGSAAGEQVRELVRSWAKQTGLSELLLRSTLPVKAANPARPRDLLARYRRADGTVEWKRAIRERALPEVGGLLHFGLALFLKEVAVVAATGDRARIEEFFDGLMSTDFYKHYGLFVAGARVGEVAYTRYLQRYIKPRFVNGLLKTNLVLAAGIALPMIVEGKFEGRAFAISVASLGLSSAAVRGGVAGLKWVLDLKKAQRTGALARFGARAGRLAKLGGWFYSAVELAVILYVAEEIDRRVTTALDTRKAKGEVGQAAEVLIAAVNDPRATPASLAAAAQAHHEAWIKYRDFLYRPLEDAELLFAARLSRVARLAKLKADERKAALEKLKQHAALRRSIERRYGSLERYADHLLRKDEAEIAKTVNTYTASYTRARDGLLDQVYTSNRRGKPQLGSVGDLDWLLDGGKDQAANDPYGRRSDIFAHWGRHGARSDLAGALREPSSNRLEAYTDEAELLTALQRRLRARGATTLAEALEPELARIRRLAAADRALYQGGGLVPAGSLGASGELERTGR